MTATDTLPTAWRAHYRNAYAIGEDLFVIRGRNNRTRRRVPLIWCHAALDTALITRDGVVYRRLVEIAHIAGVTVLAADLGGTLTWGNDTSIERIDSLIAWAADNLDVRTDLVAIAGDSMGGLLGLNWAWRNHTRVAAMWFRAPCVALEAFHDSHGGFAGTIEAAYGGEAGYLSALPDHDPVQNTLPIRGMRHLLRIDAQADDELIDPQWIRDYAADVGIDVHWHPGTHIDALRVPRHLEAAEFLADLIPDGAGVWVPPPPPPPSPIALGVPLIGAHSVEAGGLTSVSIPEPAAADDPTVAQGLAVGDHLIAAIAWDASGGATLSLPSGQETQWVDLIPETTLGTRRLRVLARDRRAGDDDTYDFTLSVNASHRATLAVVRGAKAISDWTAGTVGTRAGGSGTSTTTIAPSVTTDTENNRVLSVAAEATGAGSGAGELVSVDGAGLWFFAEVGGAGSSAIETIAVAEIEQVEPGATAPVTFTYENPQASNGAAVQIAIPGATIPAGGWTIDDLLNDSPFTIAHRCHGGWWPENTLYAAQQAAYVSKVLDIDVWRTADGVFVCHHDQSTNRMTGVDLDIPSSSWAELQDLMNQPDECIDTDQPARPMARLEQILDNFPNHIISIEMKGPGSASMAPFLDLLDTYDRKDRSSSRCSPAGRASSPRPRPAATPPGPTPSTKRSPTTPNGSAPTSTSSASTGTPPTSNGRPPSPTANRRSGTSSAASPRPSPRSARAPTGSPSLAGDPRLTTGPLSAP